MGGNAQHLNAVPLIRGQLGNIIIGAHGHAAVHGAAGVGRQQSVQLFNGVADGHIGVVAIHIAQKAHFHNVSPGTGQ